MNHFAVYLQLTQYCKVKKKKNLYVEKIMQNPRLDEAQAGMKVAGRNINNVSYTDDTTLMAEPEEELKSLLKMKEESENVKMLA